MYDSVLIYSRHHAPQQTASLHLFGASCESSMYLKLLIMLATIRKGAPDSNSDINWISLSKALLTERLLHIGIQLLHVSPCLEKQSSSKRGV